MRFDGKTLISHPNNTATIPPATQAILSLNKLLCTHIWNIEKEKVGDRPAKLNEKKSDRAKAEIKKKAKETFFIGRTMKSGGEKMRNVMMKMSGSEKKK